MYLQLKGRRVFYDLLGSDDAPRTVCFGHSLSADSSMWAEQVPVLLASGFRVLRIDMRGHGASAAVPGDYTMDQLADDVADVVTALKVGPVDFIGLSIGGMYGQSLALRHAGLLRSAMFCDTLPASIAGADATWVERKKIVSEAGSLAPLADGTMERWFTPALKDRRPNRWAEVRASIVNTDPQGFLGCAAAIRSFDFTSELPTLKLPVLVLCGADDAGTPPAENERLAGLIPGARYVQLDDCRHLPNIERPEAFNEVMTDWLSARGA